MAGSVRGRGSLPSLDVTLAWPHRWAFLPAALHGARALAPGGLPSRTGQCGGSPQGQSAGCPTSLGHGALFHWALVSQTHSHCGQRAAADGVKARE